MERRLKERLTGAVVLLLLAVIFVPMLLDNSAQDDIGISSTNIPPEPEVDFGPAIQPVEPLPQLEPPSMPLETIAGELTPVNSGEADLATTLASMTPASEVVAEPVPPVVEVPAQQGTVSAENNPAPVSSPTVDTTRRAVKAWVIQLGSFSSQGNADSLVRQLQNQGFPAYIEKVTTDKGAVFKVRVGPELSRPAAETIVKNLKEKMKLDGMIISFP